MHEILLYLLHRAYHLSNTLWWGQVHAGKDGTAGNPAEGSSGPLARRIARRRMASLRIGVPPGTVVKKKKGGQLLGELINPGVHLSNKLIIFFTDTKVGCETGGNEQVVPHLICRYITLTVLLSCSYHSTLYWIYCYVMKRVPEVRASLVRKVMAIHSYCHIHTYCILHIYRYIYSPKALLLEVCSSGPSSSPGLAVREPRTCVQNTLHDSQPHITPGETNSCTH